MARGKHMKALDALIDEKVAEIERLQVELAALREAKRRVSGDAAAIPKRRAPRSNVKQAVLDLLKEVRHSGLNAAIAVQMAEERGETLDRGSVSSLLSRLKGEGVVTHDGRFYKLAEFAENKPGAPVEEANASVH